LFWYSRRPGGGFALWDARGFDPDTNEELEPVRTKEKREEILSWLRAEARRNPKPVKVEPKPAPKRLAIRNADDISFVNELGSNIVWFFGSPETGYELYDAPGFHRTGARLLPADSQDVRQAILKWFRQCGQTAPNTQPAETVLRSTAPNPSQATHQADGQQSQLGKIPRTDSPATKESWGEFASEARRAVANDLLRQDESAFGRVFTLQCTSASQSRRRANAYGVNSDVVVVTASFRLSTLEGKASGSSWLKTYEVVESIAADQFQGLTSADTIGRIVGSLKEQIQKDNESLSALRKGLKP